MIIDNSAKIAELFSLGFIEEGEEFKQKELHDAEVKLAQLVSEVKASEGCIKNLEAQIAGVKKYLHDLENIG